MSVINSDSMRAGASGAGAADYVISNSCRFNDGDSPKLTWTPSGNGNTKTASISFWMKRSGISTGANRLFDAGSGYEIITLTSGDVWDIHMANQAGRLVSSQVMRDPGAWTHVLVVWDTTDAVAGNRNRLFLNGIEVTAFSTDTQPAQNDLFDRLLISGNELRIGGTGSSYYFDGYLAEYILVDGTALSPTDVGEFDSNGVWVPIDPSGLTFGTNGFWLDFADSSHFGKDVAGFSDTTYRLVQAPGRA